MDETRFKEILTQTLADQSRDLRDYVDSRFHASEKRQDTAEERLIQKMDAGEARLSHRLQESEGRILNAVAESHDLLVKPKLDDHELRITKLEGISHTS